MKHPVFHLAALALAITITLSITTAGLQAADTVESVRPFTASVHGMTFADDGTLYFSDTYRNQGTVPRVYTLPPSLEGEPVPTAITGATVSGLMWDGGNLYVCVTGGDRIRRYDASLVLQETWTVPQPWNIERIGAGLYVVTNNGLVVKLDGEGSYETIVSGLLYPFDLTAAGSDTFWVSEQVGTYSPGNVLKYDTTGQLLDSVDYTWNNPEGLESDASGRLYVADTGAGMVLRVLSAGTVETITDQYDLPIILTRHPGGDLYFNSTGASPQLVRIVPQGPAGGRTPDGSDGDPLNVSKLEGTDLELSWGASCSSGDSDYALYSGSLGSFDGHTPVLCTTGGETSAGRA